MMKFFKDGKEIPIEELNEQFIQQVEKVSPILAGFLKIVQEGERQNGQQLIDTNQESDLFKQIDQKECQMCDPYTCPDCGESLLVSFSEALEAMQDGYRVTRKSWLDNDTPAYVYLVPEQEYPTRTEAARLEFPESVPYMAYFATRRSDGKVSPCSVFDAEELLAKDWLIIDNDSGFEWLN